RSPRGPPPALRTGDRRSPGASQALVRVEVDSLRGARHGVRHRVLSLPRAASRRTAAVTMGLSNPFALAFAALYAVLVALYLWERHQQRTEVPSLLLWQSIP